NFAPLSYASLRAWRAPGDGIHLFTLNVLLNLSGLIVLLAPAGLVNLRWIRRDSAALVALENSAREVPPRALLYLAIFTAGPLVLAMVGASLSASSLRSPWAGPMICLVGLLAVGLTYSQFNQATLRRIVIFAAGLQALLPLGYALAIVCYVPATGNLFG